MPRITSFSIKGLHNAVDVRIDIRDHRVILVGVNGLGKTTIINIMYYFLTNQWARLSEYQFDELVIEAENEKLGVPKKDLASPRHLSLLRRLRRHSPELRRLEKREPNLLDVLVANPHDPRVVRRLQYEYDIPPRVLMDLRMILEDVPLQPDLFSSGSQVKKLGEEIARFVDGQVLYLPTYRRIERDLQKILPGVEERIHRRQVQGAGGRGTAFVEFVEFGMRDVEERFADVMTGLKEQARLELNNLAASYLGEVIRGEADTYDRDLISSLNEDTVEKILNRVEEGNLLNAADRARLRGVISRLKTSERKSSTQDKYMAHFFSKLASIHRVLTQAEAAVEDFVDVCNRYLVGKHIAFNDRTYVITVEQEGTDELLELQYLSSGEKQIVSLFTHIYLGEASKMMVLIDEPELSLSVPWQKQLLPDIWRAGRCTFLAAVTHSPFIYDNEFEVYATDLAGCILAR